MEALTWTSFIISVCLPWCYCFLTAHGAMCICRVEGDVGGTGDRSSCFLPRSYKLSSSSHQSSVQISVLRFDIFILCKKTKHTTNCSSPMYWNKRVTFYTSGTVLEWDCHMLISHPPPLVSYISMQFSDGHAGHLDAGLRLRNPAILYPTLVSDQMPLFHIGVVPLPGLPFCILYIL